mgnify:FL=1
MTKSKIKRPEFEVILKVNQDKGCYTAVVADGPIGAMFCGDGDSIFEAVGACVMANRELLGFALLVTGEGAIPTFTSGCTMRTQRKIMKMIKGQSQTKQTQRRRYKKE